MNRTQAQLISSLIPALLGMVVAFPDAQRHIAQVAPAVKAFGEGKPIEIGGRVCSSPHDDLTFAEPLPHNSYNVLPKLVRVNVQGKEYLIDFVGAVEAGAVSNAPHSS